MIGSSGADRFIFDDFVDNDTISDFEISVQGEYIDLSEVTAIVDFADLTSNHLSQNGSHALISDGAFTTITLLNIQKDDLTADDFLF